MNRTPQENSQKEKTPRLVASSGARLSASLMAITLGCACSNSSSVTPSDASAPFETSTQIDGNDPREAEVAAPAQVEFPTGFLFGSATSAFQVESGNTSTDWGAWVRTPGKIAGGDSPDKGGPDSLHHVDEDIALLTASGQNAYRFSIELARLYPTKDAFDRDEPSAEAVAAYDTLLTKLRTAGVSPMVTLHHFSSPLWLADPSRPSEPQGWERPEMTTVFVEFARRMGRRWGAKVDWWITINEPLNLVLGGYVQGGFPPGVLLDVERGLAVAKAELRAHAAAYDALHEADTVDADGDGKAAMVSMAFHMRTFHPYDPESPDDAEATARVERIWNRWLLDALVDGNYDNDFDGTLDGPKDARQDPMLRGRLDYIGVNYYSDTLISAFRGIRIPVLNAAVYQDRLPTTRAKTDFAWDIYPEGLGTVLDVAGSYRLPLVVTENGLADATDANRPRFLLEHLWQMGLAHSRGLDVRGYFHWALLDNFEWNSGFCPRFGLATYNPATGVRMARPSMKVYSEVISARLLPRLRVDQAPQYSSQASCLP